MNVKRVSMIDPPAFLPVATKVHSNGKARRLSWALAVLALGGCASVEMPSLVTPLPAHWRNAPAEARARPSPDLRGWWHVFHDDQLDALVERALRANLDVARARERLMAARVLYRHAHAPFLPSLRARTSDVVDPDASASFITAGFDAVWEFGVFGRAEGAARATQGQLAAAAADLRSVRVSLVAEVVRNWIELRSAQQREQWLRALRDSRRRYRDVLHTRVTLGLASPQQELHALADLAEAEGALSAPRQEANAAAQRLAVLLGRNTPDSSWLAPGPLPQLGAVAFAGAPAELLRTRPEIARAEADVLRVAGELGVARADMYPSIGFGASIVGSTSFASNRPDPGADMIIGVGPLIDIPLFDWGMRAARSDAKAHELRAAALAYRQAVITGAGEVETALGAFEQQRRREDASVKAWRALARSAQREDARARLGLSGGIERDQALIARDQAAAAVVEARAARDIAYVALYKALGGAPEPRVETALPAPAGDAH